MLNARALMLGAAAITTKFLSCVVCNRQANVLNIALGKMKPAHAAVVVALLLVILAVAALAPVCHSSPVSPRVFSSFPSCTWERNYDPSLLGHAN